MLLKEFKKSRAPSLDPVAAELLKCGGTYPILETHSLLDEIWNTDAMPDELLVRIICLIHKNYDKSVYENYRRITLLNLKYKGTHKNNGKEVDATSGENSGKVSSGLQTWDIDY